MSEGAVAPRVLECEGAPRDLGLDQGLAVRALLRRFAASQGAELPADEEVARGGLGIPLLERLASGLGAALRGRAVRDRAARLLARDLARHFPQLAERCEGLARGGRIPASVLLAACARELERDAGAAVLVEVADRATPLLLRGLPETSELVARWRRSRPENGLRSLELVSPAGLGAVAGVNEAGLAVAWAARRARLAPAADARCAAPATLLAQECLQRFESVAGAAAWCADRPGLGADETGEPIELVLVDAAGAVSGVTRSGDGRAARFAPRRVRLAATADALAAEARGGALVLDPAGRRARLVASAGDLVAEPSDAAAWLAVAPAED